MRMVVLLLWLSLIAAAQSVPEALHQLKTENGMQSFRANVTVYAIGSADEDGIVHWNDFCQVPITAGTVSQVAAARRGILAVVTARGAYGDLGAAAALGAHYAAAVAEFSRWLTLVRERPETGSAFRAWLKEKLDSAGPPSFVRDEAGVDRMAIQLEPGMDQVGALLQLRLAMRAAELTSPAGPEPHAFYVAYLEHQVKAFTACAQGTKPAGVGK